MPKHCCLENYFDTRSVRKHVIEPGEKYLALQTEDGLYIKLCVWTECLTPRYESAPRFNSSTRH